MITESFRVLPSRYARHLMQMWTARHWWIIAVPPIIALTLALTVDWRFLFVAVILVFLVIPHIMVTVYYYHAMSPRSAMSILPHRVVFEDSALRIKYDLKQEECAVNTDEDTEKQATQPERPDDIIPYSEITAITTKKSDLILHLSSGDYHILVIPLANLPEGAELPLPPIS